MNRAVALGFVASAAGCASATDHNGSLEIRRMSIGAKTEISDLDLMGLEATYFVPNPNNPYGFDRVVATNSGRAWTADLPGPSPVNFTMPTYPVPRPQMWSFPNLATTGLFAVLEHPHPTPADAGAMLTVTATLDTPLVANESFQMYTVGSWTQRPFAATELPAVGTKQLGPVTYPFDSSTSITGRPLEKLTARDAVFVLRYVGTDLTGVATIPPFDQNGHDMLSATMTRVSHDQTLAVSFDPSSIMGRLATTKPQVAGFGINWSLVASPAAKLAVGGPQLQAGSATMTDTALNVPFGNPFVDRGWDTVFTFVTYASRTYPATPPQATLYAALQQFVSPTPGLAMNVPAALPQVISVDGIALTTDGLSIAQPKKFVDVSFTTDLPGTTLYHAILYQLVPNAMGTALTYQLVYSAAGTDSKFPFPPEVFQPGQLYLIRAICTQGGFPNIGEGHLEERELPFAQGYLDSGVFTVM